MPFLHGGPPRSANFIKVLISDDGGLTFRFSNFNVPGAPDPTAFPNVTPGTLTDCRVNGGFRVTLHAGQDQGGGRMSLPVFPNATRLITQPSTVVQRGKVFIAYNASTSSTFGDQNSRSEIRLLFSPNGGATWQGYGDNRNSWTSPPQSPAAGRHSQPDVFANRLGLDD